MIEASYSVFDDRFTVDEIDTHDLIIEATLNRFKFILKQSSSGLIIWLEDYFFDLDIDIEVASQRIKSIITNHKFLSANYWNSITILFSSPFFVWIPENFKDKDLNSKYLKLYFPKLPLNQFTLFSNNINNKNGDFVFAEHNLMVSVFKEIYNGKELNFESSINKCINFFIQNKNLSSQNIILISDKSLLLIYKSIKTKNFKAEKIPLESPKMKEFLNYNFKDAQITTLAYGEITNYSPFYKRMKTIAKGMELGLLPDSVTLSQYFIDTPEHRYLTLFI